MKIYAVKKGNKTGIFKSWEECQLAIKGYHGAEFKSFTTSDEAEAYLENRDVWIEKVAQDNCDGYLVAFINGSFDTKLKRYSYGVELIKPDGSESELYGYDNNPEFLDSNNIIGEILGVINALDWAISNGFKKIKIYHNYEGVSKWILGEWSANSITAQFYLDIFNNKYKDFIEFEFFKIPVHGNIIYNEKADRIAKSALFDKKKTVVQGANWFTISYFSKEDFDAIIELVIESDERIKYTCSSQSDKVLYKFKLEDDSLTITLFLTGQHKLLLQGKNNYLFQVITSIIIELYDDSHVEQILGDAYRISIKEDVVLTMYKQIENVLPNNYPLGIKRLIKQSIINMTHYFGSEEYSLYVFPALRALEGHIKYLITESGGVVGRQFSCFGCDKTVTPYRYFVSQHFPNNVKNHSIENCYNYYKAQRDTIFHFGDILGVTDNTRLIESKDEADEIINKCITLISTEI
ncbi:viroplasmin family protein [Gemella sanguinis]|uniref:ribonuclease H1 domain-containing protein n=1 Tax=Gemella sanguinis TaxID=84135 RepID=UPI0028EC5DAA|nr:viroplasmin family protein [Gemella sanguinis]